MKTIRDLEIAVEDARCSFVNADSRYTHWDSQLTIDSASSLAISALPDDATYAQVQKVFWAARVVALSSVCQLLDQERTDAAEDHVGLRRQLDAARNQGDPA